MKMYTCYETSQTMTKADWHNYYNNNIDHTEYAEFSIWWADMRKSGVLEINVI